MAAVPDLDDGARPQREGPRRMSEAHTGVIWLAMTRRDRAPGPLEAIPHGADQAYSGGDGARRAQRPPAGGAPAGLTVAKVFTKARSSPGGRRGRCALAGLGAVAETDPDLVEWDSTGQYEGRRSAEVHRPGRPGLDALCATAPGRVAGPEWAPGPSRGPVSRVRQVPGTCCSSPAGTSARVLAALLAQRARSVGPPGGTSC